MHVILRTSAAAPPIMPPMMLVELVCPESDERAEVVVCNTSSVDELVDTCCASIGVGVGGSIYEDGDKDGLRGGQCGDTGGGNKGAGIVGGPGPKGGGSCTHDASRAHTKVSVGRGHTNRFPERKRGSISVEMEQSCVWMEDSVAGKVPDSWFQNRLNRVRNCTKLPRDIGTVPTSRLFCNARLDSRCVNNPIEVGMVPLSWLLERINDPLIRDSELKSEGIVPIKLL